MNQHRTFPVKARDLRRAGIEPVTYQSVERHKLPVGASDEHKFQHIYFAAKVNVRLHDNFVRPTESVVVVNLHAAEIYLQCAVNVRKIHAEHFNLFLVEFIFVAGRSHAESCAYALKFRPRISRQNYFIGYVRKFSVRVALLVDKLHR